MKKRTDGQLTYLQRHPEKRREYQNRYHAKFRQRAFNAYLRWNEAEIIAAINSSLTDANIHRAIGRSVCAIKHKRHILKKKGVLKEYTLRSI